jgi:hypothetical protein
MSRTPSPDAAPAVPAPRAPFDGHPEFATTYAFVDVDEGAHRQQADAVADGRVPATPDT